MLRINSIIFIIFLSSITCISQNLKFESKSFRIDSSGNLIDICIELTHYLNSDTSVIWEKSKIKSFEQKERFRLLELDEFYFTRELELQNGEIISFEGEYEKIIFETREKSKKIILKSGEKIDYYVYIYNSKLFKSIINEYNIKKGTNAKAVKIVLNVYSTKNKSLVIKIEQKMDEIPCR